MNKEMILFWLVQEYRGPVVFQSMFFVNWVKSFGRPNKHSKKLTQFASNYMLYLAQ